MEGERGGGGGSGKFGSGPPCPDRIRAAPHGHHLWRAREGEEEARGRSDPGLHA